MSQSQIEDHRSRIEDRIKQVTEQMVLHGEEGMTQTEIIKATGMSRSLTVQTLTQMVKRGTMLRVKNAANVYNYYLSS